MKTLIVAILLAANPNDPWAGFFERTKQAWLKQCSTPEGCLVLFFTLVPIIMFFVVIFSPGDKDKKTKTKTKNKKGK